MVKKSKVWASLNAYFIIVVASFTWLMLATANAQTYYLGVLAPQGETVAQERWQPWLNQLNEQLQEDTVVLVPLALENWQQEIEAQQFALVLGPQVQLIKMNTTHWRWLATLQADTQTAQLDRPDDNQGKNFHKKSFNKSADKQLSTTVNLANKFNKLSQGSPLKEPSAMEAVASALWVKADSGIYQLQDLQQRKIAAVDSEAFGGYLLVAHLLQQNGVPSNRYQTQFVGYPIERTLHALASGSVDAAIAPLCLMEEMAQQGKISKKQYRLIHPVATASSCQSSTKIYPNWTLAATEQAPAALIRQINQNLFGLSQYGKSQPEQESLGIGQRWLPAESSSDAERILYDMNRHPAQKQLGAHMVDWVKAHRLWMAVIVLIVLISTVNYAWMSWLAWRRRQKIILQNQLIRDYDQQLRQSERFAVIGEMSGSIAHEINQPLATIQNYAQGLLIRSQSSVSRQDGKESTVLDKNSAHSLNALEKTLTDKQVLEKQAIDKQATESALQQIVNETERVAAVISNIRRWAGRSQPNNVQVDIVTTYAQCILLLGEKASSIGFWLASDYQTLQLPSLVLDQLLMNSMLNAEQQGATQIMLRCQAKDYNGKSYIVLHITDDAGGFDEAQLLDHKPLEGNQQLVEGQSQQRLTNKYATKSTKENGLGLGLMICQRLCKSIGGMMQLGNIEFQQELNTIQALDGYQQRLKRSLNGKVRLIKMENTHPLANRVGAQVSFYLPLHLADDAQK
ncbi:PhnD/SsuA/transferrin family substrate-binding protein [Psychrobacter faecalis]|uniref:histidine kinase n=1 Tax=Psychrobacter faecalis TaxID=180588 RepID=A0ABT9HED9_9GAMM|nr:PhnD/SsuA/transferrin family substrate-binding protein [Psychrobacter faecalis]MDP4544130.1 PhnD/SsuA/transferrin family substrate-binding protein [Psychrobacter faecalis]